MKKKIIIPIVIIVVLILSVITIFIVKNINEEKIKEEQETLVKTINSHYNEFVVTTKETKLYKKENNKYIESGKVSEGINLTLIKEEIDYNTKYFLISGLDMYISYEDVKPINEYTVDDSYKHYIVFNKNITTKNITNFYDYDNNLKYTINSSFDFKVIVMDTDRYGIEYNNELLYVKSNDVEKIYDNHNTDEVGKSRIKTLTYHFIYDPEYTKCNEMICHSFSQWESHLKYLSENDYFTLKMQDVELYMDGKINIPQKSTVLTIDDATIFDPGAIRLLEKYDLYATIFVITGARTEVESLKSNHLALESHTDNMHNQYECSGMGSQGGGILCLPEEKVLADLKTSQEKVGGSKYFAYPFYDFNERAIELLKKAGFNMAFIGIYDTDGYSYPNKTNKYMLRRQAIFTSTTMEEFVSYLR